MSLEEYLAWELQQEAKHDWVDGEIVAFAGGRNQHQWLARELLTRIGPHVRPCQAGGSDTRVQTPKSMRYPDVVVTCDERDRPKDLCVRFPKLIIEILSDSTETIDRTKKFDEYTAIQTLQEYALIDSRKHWAQVFRRSDDGWLMRPVVRIGNLYLESIDLELDLDKMYDNASVDEPEDN